MQTPNAHTAAAMSRVVCTGQRSNRLPAIILAPTAPSVVTLKARLWALAAFSGAITRLT